MLNKTGTFTPTWLYIKQHNTTGLKYFGKTVKKDPIKYLGSGTYWKNHLNHHGLDISTLWCKLFLDKDSLVEYATKFSIENNIVDAVDDNGRKIWANLEIEDGLSGSGLKRKNSLETIEKRRKSCTGKKRTVEQKERMRQAQLARPPKKLTDEELIAFRSRMSKVHKGIPKSNLHKEKISESLKGKTKGKPKSELTKQRMKKPKSKEHAQNISLAASNRPRTPCMHCGRLLQAQHMSKHLKNCNS